MKIASNAMLKSLLKSGSALGLLFMIGGGVTSAYAVDAPVTPPPAVVNFAPSDASTGSGVAPPAFPSSLNAGTPSKNLAALEDKVSDSIKGVVKQLGSTENVNLEDMNTARQAVAKLDVLIDIEKRLSELEKVRSDRGGQKSLAASIPASALTPPPMPSAPLPVFKSTPSSDLPTFTATPAVSHSDVSRITGANGHYVAVIQGKNIRIGDTLSDGSSVIAISASSVSTKSKDGIVRSLKVKGVDEVYGHSL